MLYSNTTQLLFKVVLDSIVSFSTTQDDFDMVKVHTYIHVGGSSVQSVHTQTTLCHSDDLGNIIFQAGSTRFACFFLF